MRIAENYYIILKDLEGRYDNKYIWPKKLNVDKKLLKINNFLISGIIMSDQLCAN